MWYAIGYIVIGLIFAIVFGLVETWRDRIEYPTTIAQEGWDHYLETNIALGMFGGLMWPVTIPLIIACIFAIGLSRGIAYIIKKVIVRG